jgi:hypothetical protein
MYSNENKDGKIIKILLDLLFYEDEELRKEAYELLQIYSTKKKTFLKSL